MTHAKADIDAILSAMIVAYPRLRSSRMDALYEIAVHHDAEWNEVGDVVVSRHSTLRDSPELSEDEDSTVIGYRETLATARQDSFDYRFAQEQLANRLLYMREDKMQMDFIRDNVDLILQDGSRCFQSQVPGMRLRLLETVPANANPLWIEAFIQLCNEIMVYQFPPSKFEGMTQSYADEYANRLEVAKQSAREARVRLKGSDADKKALAVTKFEERLAILKAEAAQQGVSIEATIA